MNHEDCIVGLWAGLMFNADERAHEAYGWLSMSESECLGKGWV